MKKAKAIPKEKTIYLRDFLLIDEREKIKEGDLVTQSYPFYTGSVIYKQKIRMDAPSFKERIFLQFQDFQAITAKVTINHKEVGLVFWPPYQIDISSFLKEGENLIEIELTNSLRNLLGPHHNNLGEQKWVDTRSFTDETHWVEGYNFIPFGLKRVRLIRARV